MMYFYKVTNIFNFINLFIYNFFTKQINWYMYLIRIIIYLSSFLILNYLFQLLWFRRSFYIISYCFFYYGSCSWSLCYVSCSYNLRYSYCVCSCFFFCTCNQTVKSCSTMSGISVLRILWFGCWFLSRTVKSCSTMSGVSVLRILWFCCCYNRYVKSCL